VLTLQLHGNKIVTAWMLPRTLQGSIGAAACLLLCVSAIACEKVPLLAPTGSTITLTATATAISASGSTPIVVQVLEASGTPPHSGTHVTLTTTLGRIEPPEVSTDVTGRATATFLAGGANGLAIIGANSGGATTGTEGVLKIAVGAAAVARVSVSANPTSVSSGGATTITAGVLDVNSNALVGVPVTFTTTAGSLSSGLVPTNGSGLATTTLTTSAQATVTATVGAGGETGNNSASVTVNVLTAPALTIIVPGTITKGIPASFTFAVTGAGPSTSSVRDVVVNWGDGTTDSLGPIVQQTIQHRYTNDGPFRITATVHDSAGGATPYSTSVTVNPLAKPAIVITPSPLTAAVNTTVTITISVTAAAGTSLQSVHVDFGDGETRSLGGTASATLPHRYTTPGTKTITVTVVDTADQVSSGSADVIITP
jgi:hypothetical protein